FVGSDIAKALGYSEPHKAVTRHTKGGMKRTILTNGGNQEMLVIPEGDVYRLIVKSKLPQAEKFESWVFDEVLPTIRKHGMYARDEILDNPDLLIQVASELKKEREQRKQLEITVQEQAPKVLFADAVSTSDTTILVGELAKLIKQNGIDMGQNRLFAWLRDNGYLIKKKGADYNMPTQRSMELKLFEIKEGTRVHSDGHVSITKTPKVTGKGQVYFINKFIEVA
ncbi:MAG: phage antirepressor KilAC domain-containing protein, partial [Turicibacter sp.]|nr:phage antirepressor KilAC domain-containing protein [Turicibacter sp.]